MNKTINYGFNLPQLINAAFIIKYNENIVEIDRLLKKWQNIINVEIENITNNVVGDINEDIARLEKEIYNNKVSNNMLKSNVLEVYNKINNENNVLMNYFENRFITIENNISNVTLELDTINQTYNETITIVNQNITNVEQLSNDNTTFKNELNTMNEKINLANEQLVDNDERLEIFRTKLINFINTNSTQSISSDASFYDALDTFLIVYREV